MLLFTLILLKVSSFHVYTHHDSASNDIENCAFCELAIENQQTAYTLNTPQLFSTAFLETNRNVLAKEYKAVTTSTCFTLHLFGRPPPFAV